MDCLLLEDEFGGFWKIGFPQGCRCGVYPRLPVVEIRQTIPAKNDRMPLLLSSDVKCLGKDLRRGEYCTFQKVLNQVGFNELEVMVSFLKHMWVSHHFFLHGTCKIEGLYEPSRLGDFRV